MTQPMTTIASPTKIIGVMVGLKLGNGGFICGNSGLVTIRRGSWKKQNPTTLSPIPRMIEPRLEWEMPLKAKKVPQPQRTTSDNHLLINTSRLLAGTSISVTPNA